MWSALWLATTLAAAPVTTAGTTTTAARAELAPAEAIPLTFADLLAPGPALKPSPRLATLAGHRVKLAGFMAELEEPPRGAFYLASRPVRCDEGGGGTGDLPPDAVRVVVRSASGEEIPFYPGLLEVTGLLETGAQADEDGRPSYFRVTLDRPEDLGRPPSRSTPTATAPAVTSKPANP
jgi:hypothetical protein